MFVSDFKLLLQNSGNTVSAVAFDLQDFLLKGSLVSFVQNKQILEGADTICCEKPYILITIYPLVLAFLIIRTVEVYCYYMLLE